MADPLVVAVPANAWTVVATNVKSGMIHILSPTGDGWFQTFNATGTGVPVDVPAVILPFQNTPISSAVAIDVYLYHKGSVGSVRVDV